VRSDDYARHVLDVTHADDAAATAVTLRAWLCIAARSTFR